MKKFLQIILMTFTVLSFVYLTSCGGKNKEKGIEEDTMVETQKETIEPRTIQVQLLPEMPVKGDQADYFTFTAPNGSDTITVTGTPPDESSYSSAGTIKVVLNLTVNKSLNDKVYDLHRISLHFLDEDREDIGSLSMNSTDKELVIAELEKATPGTISITFKDSEYERSYNKIFDKAKYIRIEGVEFESEKEHAREEAVKAKEEAAAERAAAREARSSERSSYSDDSSDDDSDYDDNDRKSMKRAYKKAKEKISTKAKDLKEKAAEKLNDWLD